MLNEQKLIKEFLSKQICPCCETSDSLQLKYLYPEVDPMIHEFKCSICGNTGIACYKSKNKHEIMINQGKYNSKQKRKLLKKQKYE